jgi:hypothetical protein
MSLRIAHDASEQGPIIENPVALRDGRADIADGRFSIRCHDKIAQDREIRRGFPCSTRAALKIVACSATTWFLRRDDSASGTSLILSL